LFFVLISFFFISFVLIFVFPVSLTQSIQALLTPVDWSMSDTERQWYLKVFTEADVDKDSFVTAEEARAVFLKSGLEVTALSQVSIVLFVLCSDGCCEHCIVCAMF
jgi:hypothetical protein